MKKIFLLALTLIFTSLMGYAQNQASGKKLTDTERMAWWHDAKFGMFIHWGLYSIPAGSTGAIPAKAMLNG